MTPQYSLLTTLPCLNTHHLVTSPHLLIEFLTSMHYSSAIARVLMHSSAHNYWYIVPDLQKNLPVCQWDQLYDRGLNGDVPKWRSEHRSAFHPSDTHTLLVCRVLRTV